MFDSIRNIADIADGVGLILAASAALLLAAFFTCKHTIAYLKGWWRR